MKQSRNTLSGAIKTPILITVALLLAFVVGGAIWFLGVRPKVAPTNTNTNSTQNPGGAQTNTQATMSPPPAAEQAADADRDGLTDAEEAQAGTKPDMADSDDDGLSDRAEVKVYATNALDPDTDDDGDQDGQEVQAGNDPKGPGVLLDLEKAIENLNSSGG